MEEDLELETIQSLSWHLHPQQCCEKFYTDERQVAKLLALQTYTQRKPALAVMVRSSSRLVAILRLNTL